MGTEPKARKHERIREDVLAAVDAVRGITPALPAISLYIWSLRQFLRPLRTGFLGPRTITGADDPRVLAELLARLGATVGPFAAFLGIMYQGLQGAIAGLVASMLPAASAAMLEVEIVKKQNIADEPFPGAPAYGRLMWFDALFLASLAPLVLETLRGQGVERSSLVP